jgi:hypothetical protein
VIVGDLVPDGRARPDHLDAPYLLFTACFDGPLDSYLDELCDELVAEAPRSGALRRRAAAARRRRPEGLPARAPVHDRLLRRRLSAGHRRPRARALAQREDVIAFARAPRHGPRAAAGRVPRAARRLTVAGAPLDLADLQGDILRAYGNAYAAHDLPLLPRRRRRRGRRLAARLLARVTTARALAAAQARRRSTSP